MFPESTTSGWDINSVQQSPSILSIFSAGREIVPHFTEPEDWSQFSQKLAIYAYLEWELSSLVPSCPTSRRSALIFHLLLGFRIGLFGFSKWSDTFAYSYQTLSIHVSSDVWENISIHFLDFCGIVAEDSILLGYEAIPWGKSSCCFKTVSCFSIKVWNVQKLWQFGL